MDRRASFGRRYDDGPLTVGGFLVIAGAAATGVLVMVALFGLGALVGRLIAWASAGPL